MKNDVRSFKYIIDISIIWMEETSQLAFLIGSLEIVLFQGSNRQSLCFAYSAKQEQHEYEIVKEIRYRNWSPAQMRSPWRHKVPTNKETVFLISDSRLFKILMTSLTSYLGRHYNNYTTK